MQDFTFRYCCYYHYELFKLKTFYIYTGSGESGKSTLLKQMKIINLNGYSEEELFTWRATVYRNVVESAQTIVQTISELGLSYEKPELNVNINTCIICVYTF